MINTFLASLLDTVTVSWMIVITILVTTISYIALQALEFTNIFKKSSTWQIRILILFISLAIGLIIGVGCGILIEKIIEIF